jgi:chromosome segregation ATPase
MNLEEMQSDGLITEVKRLREEVELWMKTCRDAEDEKEKLEAELSACKERMMDLEEILGWITVRYEQTLAGKSVRDADEVIHKANKALQAQKQTKKAGAPEVIQMRK